MLQQRVPDHGRRSTTYTRRSVSPTESSRAFSSSDRFFRRPVRLVRRNPLRYSESRGRVTSKRDNERKREATFRKKQPIQNTNKLKVSVI